MTNPTPFNVETVLIYRRYACMSPTGLPLLPPVVGNSVLSEDNLESERKEKSRL